MPRNIGCSLLIYVLALFSPCATAAQEAVNSFRDRLTDFANELRSRDALELLRVIRIKSVSEPKAQAVEILKSAWLLVEGEKGLEAVSLVQLVPGRDLQWMADLLVENGVIRQDDYLVQVDWSLRGQKFQTLAAVNSKDRSRLLFRPLRLSEAPDFEPLLYFTPIRTEESPIDDETSVREEGGKDETSTPLRLPAISEAFASMLAYIAVPPKANDSSHRSGSRKLTIWNGHGPCATVIWKVVFMTDGCRIRDEGSHTFPSVEISRSLSCLFWDVKNKPVEIRTWKPRGECPPRPGTEERAEECLKAMLEYTPGLRLLNGFLPIRRPSNTEPQYICCGK